LILYSVKMKVFLVLVLYSLRKYKPLFYNKVKINFYSQQDIKETRSRTVINIFKKEKKIVSCDTQL